MKSLELVDHITLRARVKHRIKPLEEGLDFEQQFSLRQTLNYFHSLAQRPLPRPPGRRGLLRALPRAASLTSAQSVATAARPDRERPGPEGELHQSPGEQAARAVSA
jgi:hypothetical protein